MNKNKTQLSFIFLLSLGISACSFNEQENDGYRENKSLPTIEIPPDLTQQDDSDNLALPGSKLGTNSLTGRPLLVGEINMRVLPNIKFVRLEGQGDFHWLSVGIAAEKLYLEVRDFWQEEGYLMALDEPVIGMMETDWVANSSGIVEGGDSSSASWLDNLPANKTEDRFRTRLERVDNEATTRVYITHRGQELMSANFERDGETPVGWQSRPNNPEAEVEMLARLMVYLGLRDDEVKVELAKYGVFEPRAAIINDDAEVETFLLLKETYSRAWNRTLNQLYRMDMQIDRKDKKAGIIEITTNVERELQKTDGETAVSAAQEQPTLKLTLRFSASGQTTTRIFAQPVDGDSRYNEQAVNFLQHLHKSLK